MQAYLGDLWNIDLRTGGNLRVGFFTDFFNALSLDGCDNLLTLKTDIVRKHLFEMPSGHPSHGKSFHPLLLLFISFRLLNFGNVDISNLYEPEMDLYSLYSEHLFAFVYLVLAEFYSSDGTITFSGAECNSSLSTL